MVKDEGSGRWKAKPTDSSDVTCQPWNQLRDMSARTHIAETLCLVLQASAFTGFDLGIIHYHRSTTATVG